MAASAFSHTGCRHSTPRLTDLGFSEIEFVCSQKRVSLEGREGWTEAPTSLAADRFLFLKIMGVLTELRSINAQQTQQLLRIQDTHPFATPLMQELFSSTDG